MPDESNCEKCRLKDRPRYEPEAPVGDVDIMIVASYPEERDCKLNSPSSDIFHAVKIPIINAPKTLKPAYRFAVPCQPFYCQEKKGFEVKAADVDRCKSNLINEVKNCRPKAILLCGTHACKAFGIKQNLTNIRGRILTYNIDELTIPVLPTYALEVLKKKPGFFEVVRKDVKKVIDLCSGGIERPEIIIDTPTSFENVISAFDKIDALAADTKSTKGQKTVLGVDTETTSLEPHKEGGRVIAISLSVGDSYSVAFPLDHREASYTTEQREAILNRFENLMNSENTVTCAANGKFDYKWLHHVYGLNINFFDFDVLLAEHILSEDKVGEYNLKSLTRDYCPGFAGYEEKLDIELRNIKRQKKEAYQAEKDKQLKKFCSDWESFSNEKRKTYLETWVAEKYIPATRIKEFTEIRRVKKLGQMIISKNYFNGLMKTLGQVPLEALGIELADQPETTFEDVSLETLLWYAAVDAYTTRSIFAAQYKMMSEEFLLIKRRGFEKLTIPLFQGFTDITMPLAAKIQDMEFIGVRLDREKAETYMDIIDDKLATIKEALFSDIGRKINLSSSSSDLRNFIFKDRKCTPIKYTDSGQAALDTGVLKELYDIHNDHFFKNLVTYRKLSKAKSAYIANFLKMSDYDGRLHFSLHQNQTATYRLSASKPSMQNVPFRLEEADLNLKSLFIPDSDDYEFYDLDIANAEMRVLCAYSRDETLIDAFDNNMDLHSLTGSKVSSFSYEQLESKKEDKHSEEYRCRQLGKKINFGTVYCVGAETLKNQLWSDLRVEVSLKEAEEYLNKFFKEYPGVKNYIDYTKKLASKHRFVTTFTGRRRRFPLIRRRGFYRGGMERQSVNSRIQSTSADIMNTNLVDLADVIEPLGGRIVLTVHDSILFQLPKGAKGVPEMLDEVFIKRTGERFPWLPVKWKYDVWKGPSYGDCKQPVF